MMVRDLASPRTQKRSNHTGEMRFLEVNQKRQQQFISIAEATVSRYLQGETAPLLIAGNERMCSAFADTCSYPFLLPTHIHADSTTKGERDLHERASEEITRFTLNLEQLAIEDFLSAEAHNRAVTGLDDVAQALQIGRVKRLFVAEDTHLTGKIQREENVLTLITKDAEGDDLLDGLAELAAAHKSQVIVLPRKRMPANAAAAATLRW